MSIPKHILNLTQSNRILELLKIRGEEGVHVWELTGARPNGLGCQQYNARIKELREAKHNIINKTPGHFVLIQPLSARKAVIVKSEEVVNKVQLSEETKRSWNAVGAYLRGEGPRPDIRPKVEQIIQESMF